MALTAATGEIRPVDPEHPDAQHCLAEYVAELNRRATRRIDEPFADHWLEKSLG